MQSWNEIKIKNREGFLLFINTLKQTEKHSDNNAAMFF